MRIAIYSDNFYPEMSGTSDSIITTAKGLANQGHRINFYVPSHPKRNFLLSKLEPKEIDLGPNIKIFRIPSLSYPAPSKAGRLVFPFLFTYWHVKKFNPDLIHINHLFGTGLEALFVSKLLDIPLVGTNHHTMSEFIKYGPITSKWAERAMLKYVSWLFNKCIWITAPCQAIISQMREYGFKRESQSLSNPIDVSNFSPAASHEEKKELKIKYRLSSKTILYTGRLSSEKKIDEIIKALAIVKRTFPDVTMAITGHGTGKKELVNLVDKLGLYDNVIFYGYLEPDQFSELYQASDIFAVMSTAETQCMSMMQAMAAGMPVICANAWGPPEYLSPESGYVVEPGDYEALAEKIKYLFENPEESKRLGQGGLIHVKNFSSEKIVDTWEKLFKSEIKKHIPKQKLSFVIPAHNEEAYIGQCLESVLKEISKTEYDTEVIVVNNASIDRTKEIASSYPGVRVVDEPKRGLPSARQCGFMASTGDLIANVDADIILPAGWIDKTMKEFSRNKNLVALSGPYIYYDRPKSDNALTMLFYVSGYTVHLFSRFFKVWAMLQGGNFILRREALAKVGGFNTDINFYGEDTDIAKRIQKVGKVKFTFMLPMYTSGRRFKKEGIMTTGFKYIAGFMGILFKKPLKNEYTYVGEKRTDRPDSEK